MKKCIFVFSLIFVFCEAWSVAIIRKNKTERYYSVVDCPEYGEVDHGIVTRFEANNPSMPAVRIECDDGYDLIGRPHVFCQNGQWEHIPRPQCAKRCSPPPFIQYGEVRIESRAEGPTLFKKGSLAVYSCAVGFTLVPPNSHIRECKDGVWTGIQGFCVSDGCPSPSNITNGYFALEPFPGVTNLEIHSPKTSVVLVRVGQRAHYNCNLGYVLVGERTQQCVDSGDWSPRKKPMCVPAPTTTQGPSFSLLFPAETQEQIAIEEALADDAHNVDNTGPINQLHDDETHISADSTLNQVQGDQETHFDEINIDASNVHANMMDEEVRHEANEGIDLDREERNRPCPGPPPRPDYAALVALSAGPADAASAAMASDMGLGSGAGAPAGTHLQLRCRAGYRDPSAPCEDFPLVCEDGEWRGRLPHCQPVYGCTSPPASPHAAPLGLSADGHYDTHAQVAYACLPGYTLQGPSILTCAASGCWEPQPAQPECKLDPRLFVSPRTLADYLSTSSILLVSAATALGVMLFLLGVCALVVCRRSKLAGAAQGGGRAGGSGRSWLSLQQPSAGGNAAQPPPPPPPPPASAAAAAAAAAAAQRAAAAAAAARLLDPDRVALIAYADGQLSEATQRHNRRRFGHHLRRGREWNLLWLSSLPTYEEAVRERLGGGGLSLLAQYRALHGRPPPWAPLGSGRRVRGNQQDIYVSRQSSCASHGGGLGGGCADSTGSTDTMTPSEVSTTVTLDTASSHTCSSHSASCRAACGSLASFDAASGLTSEGVPLLEEQEPDDLLPPPPPPPASAAPSDLMGGGPPYCKLRRASPDIV